jgi:D-3-phosphoglycerate dehydrogenase
MDKIIQTILVTSSSFIQSQTGQNFIKENNCHIVPGPLKDIDLIEIMSEHKNIVGIISGDDDYNKNSISEISKHGVRWISKYGTGLDSFDLDFLKEKNISIKNSPSLNGESVAQHAFTLYSLYCKNIHITANNLFHNNWYRPLNQRWQDYKIGIYGFGHVGQNLGSLLSAIDISFNYFDSVCTNHPGYMPAKDLLSNIDILFLCLPLNSSTKHFFDDAITHNNNITCLINTSRAELISKKSLFERLSKKNLHVFTDVWYEEPIVSWDEINQHHNYLHITPHVGSRTKYNIEIQSKSTIDNAIQLMKNTW